MSPETEAAADSMHTGLQPDPRLPAQPRAPHAPVPRVMPFSACPWPTVMARRKRSFMSITRRHVMVAGSMSRRANLSAVRVGVCRGAC